MYDKPQNICIPSNKYKAFNVIGGLLRCLQRLSVSKARLWKIALINDEAQQESSDICYS